ncbi:hypothetical protein DD829_20155 [Chryseobacterium sp. HMWF035]|nr:hypothetical protein DBR25_13495 [Chryseobacterium sp. HMWF001]PVV51648.1 hypothetical protein DD829_20155 [Chryseobacterium sp. HMWF035]
MQLIHHLPEALQTKHLSENVPYAVDTHPIGYPSPTQRFGYEPQRQEGKGGGTNPKTSAEKPKPSASQQKSATPQLQGAPPRLKGKTAQV